MSPVELATETTFWSMASWGGTRGGQGSSLLNRVSCLFSPMAHPLLRKVVMYYVGFLTVVFFGYTW